jgi:hypothetical protein
VDIHPAIVKLVDDVEQSVNRKFRYREEMESLFEFTREGSRKQAIEDILFHAKFVTNAAAVLARTGMNSEETGKLAAEFQVNTEKVMALLKAVVKEAPEDMKKSFAETMFPQTQEGMNNFIALLKELACFKNYAIDHQGIL